MDGIDDGRASRDVGAIMLVLICFEQTVGDSAKYSSERNEDDEADECYVEDGSLYSHS